MKVLFITPPMGSWIIFGDTKAPYVGYAMLGAFLEQRGVEVEVLDCPALGLDWADLEREVAERNPRVVGIGCGTCWLHRATEGFQRVKAVNPEIVTVGGGVHFSSLPAESLKTLPELDFVVVGEGEYTLAELVEALEMDDPDFSQIRGLAFRDGADIVLTAPRPSIENMDDLPLPAYHLFPMNRYYFGNGHWQNWVRIVTSRGCIGECNYCAQWRQYPQHQYRSRSGERIVDEIELLYRQFGIRIVEFADDYFNGSRAKMEAIGQGLLERDVKVNWLFTGRADGVVRDRDLMPMLRESGFFFAVMGVEGFDDARLEQIGKLVDMDTIVEAFSILRDNKINSLATAIIGWEDDSEASIKKLSQFIRNEVNPDVVSYLCLQPIPGSPLYDQYRDSDLPLVNDYRAYDLSHPIMPTKYLSVDDLKRLLYWLHVDFYTKPGTIFRNLFMAHSLIRSYMRMMIGQASQFKSIFMDGEYTI